MSGKIYDLSKPDDVKEYRGMLLIEDDADIINKDLGEESDIASEHVEEDSESNFDSEKDADPDDSYDESDKDTNVIFWARQS